MDIILIGFILQYLPRIRDTGAQPDGNQHMVFFLWAVQPCEIGCRAEAFIDAHGGVVIFNRTCKMQKTAVGLHLHFQTDRIFIAVLRHQMIVLNDQAIAAGTNRSLLLGGINRNFCFHSVIQNQTPEAGIHGSGFGAFLQNKTGAVSLFIDFKIQKSSRKTHRTVPFLTRELILLP